MLSASCDFTLGKAAGTEDSRVKGFTLIELVAAIFIIGVLSTLGYIGVRTYLDRAQISAAVADIRNIDLKIKTYYAQNLSFPSTLTDLGMGGLIDPWKRPYVYWPITSDPKQKVRKDRNLHPLNTDFDLFSVGKDGDTNLALTATASQDDIIRANDGHYVGLASGY
jgi:general secretion pathway protein G